MNPNLTPLPTTRWLNEKSKTRERLLKIEMFKDFTCGPP